MKFSGTMMFPDLMRLRFVRLRAKMITGFLSFPNPDPGFQVEIDGITFMASLAFALPGI